MFLHDDCNKKNSLYRFYSIFELYKYAFCFILINKLKSDLEGSESNPMSHVWPHSSVVTVHMLSDGVLGSSPGEVMGG